MSTVHVIYNLNDPQITILNDASSEQRTICYKEIIQTEVSSCFVELLNTYTRFCVNNVNQIQRHNTALIYFQFVRRELLLDAVVKHMCHIDVPQAAEITNREGKECNNYSS